MARTSLRPELPGPPHVGDLIEECYARGWTDGLPVVPPTSNRVDRMLGDAGAPDEVVAVLPPSHAIVTRRLVAANAVMAGCLPAHLPVVEAAVRAVAQPRFNLDRVLTTASSQSPVLLVSGPVSGSLDLGGDAEALGSNRRAPSTIGRALMLVLTNLASYGEGVEHATLGNPARRGWCFTESVSHSPWPGWHLDRGSTPEESWVSVFPAEPPLMIVDMGHDDPEAVLGTICESISIPGTYNAFFQEGLWLVLSPQHAQVFARHGWSRDDVARAVHERAALPADRLRNRGLYGYIDEPVRPDWSGTGVVPIVRDVDDLVVVVAGGEFGGYTAALFGEGHTVTEQVRTR